MQQIALKKIELARLKERDDYFTAIERQKKLEAETIEDAIKKQYKDNADIL